MTTLQTSDVETQIAELQVQRAFLRGAIHSKREEIIAAKLIIEDLDVKIAELKREARLCHQAAD